MTERESTIILMKKVQVLKYKYALIPLVLVVGSFFLSNKLPQNIVQILSTTGLILYLMILFKFRLGRVGIEMESNAILSPISGKIKSINEDNSKVEIKIVKNNFDSCAIRFTFADDEWENNCLINQNTDIKCEFSSEKILINKSEQSRQALLAGFILQPTECLISFPKEKIKANVKIGDKCFAGRTTLGFYNEN